MDWHIDQSIAGKYVQKGKDYIVNDGDVCYFKGIFLDLFISNVANIYPQVGQITAPKKK